MFQRFLFAIIFLATCPSAADLIINTENFEQFSAISIRSVEPENIEKHKDNTTREQREESGQYIYPSYYYSQDAETPYTWASDGYTILKDNPHDDEKVKIQRIQRDLKEYFQDDYGEKMTSLDKIYSLIDVRYYSIKTDSDVNEACILVHWKARLNGTINYCGSHKVEGSNLIFEINEWHNNAPYARYYFSDEDAWNLLEFAIASLSIIYSNPENQKLLLEKMTEIETK